MAAAPPGAGSPGGGNGTDGAGRGRRWRVADRTANAYRAGVEADLAQVLRLQQQSALPQAREILKRAQMRLGDDGPASLRARLGRAQYNQHFLERLDAIRMSRSTFAEGRLNSLADVRFQNAQADREYQEAFRDAALGNSPAIRTSRQPASRPRPCACRWWPRSMTGRRAAPQQDRRTWALRIARGADPDGWRDRVRDPATWEDRAALANLAESAPIADQPPSLLLALGERLQLAGGDGVGLLRLVQQQYPDDFWAKFTLANAVYCLARQGKGDAADAATLYQQTLAVRWEAAAVHNNLGLAFYARYWLDDDPAWRGPGAISVFQRALRLDPTNAAIHNNLGLAMKGEGLNGSARNAHLEALRLNPQLAAAHVGLGELLAAIGQLNEAIDHYQQTLRIDPEFAVAHYYLGVALPGQEPARRS